VEQAAAQQQREQGPCPEWITIVATRPEEQRCRYDHKARRDAHKACVQRSDGAAIGLQRSTKSGHASILQRNVPGLYHSKPAFSHSISPKDRRHLNQGLIGQHLHGRTRRETRALTVPCRDDQPARQRGCPGTTSPQVCKPKADNLCHTATGQAMAETGRVSYIHSMMQRFRQPATSDVGSTNRMPDPWWEEGPQSVSSQALTAHVTAIESRLHTIRLAPHLGAAALNAPTFSSAAN